MQYESAPTYGWAAVPAIYCEAELDTLLLPLLLQVGEGLCHESLGELHGSWPVAPKSPASLSRGM
jgi:hypothetical protein